jgi:hypothetical protein
MAASKKKAMGKRFRLYGNGLYMPLPGGKAFGGTMYNFGAHLQIKVIRGVDAKVTEWGGIDITSGFEYSGYQLNLKRELPLEAPLDDGDITWTANGDYGLSASATSIPIEVSSRANTGTRNADHPVCNGRQFNHIHNIHVAVQIHIPTGVGTPEASVTTVDGRSADASADGDRDRSPARGTGGRGGLGDAYGRLLGGQIDRDQSK